MSDSNIFRSSVMGGFNRQDVLSYIEDRARTHTEELGELGRRLDCSQKELSETKSALTSAKETLTVAQAEADTYLTELDKVKAEFSQIKAENLDLKAKITSGDQALADLTAERDRYVLKLDELQSAVQDIDQAKIRVANIELEAYARAKKIEDAAISNTAMARLALSSLFVEAKKRFDQSKEDAARTIFFISQELDRLKDEMKNIPGFFDIISSQIDALKFGTEKKAESNAATMVSNTKEAEENATEPPELKTAYNPIDDMQFEELIYPFEEKHEATNDTDDDFEIIIAETACEEDKFDTLDPDLVALDGAEEDASSDDDLYQAQDVLEMNTDAVAE